VHRLCTSPATHSQIVKSLARFEGDEGSSLRQIDSILHEVAIFSHAGMSACFQCRMGWVKNTSSLLLSPGGKKQGTFKLKTELWNVAFDPYFPHYGQQQLEKAYEKYSEEYKQAHTTAHHPYP